jgi:hypothetical protein
MDHTISNLTALHLSPSACCTSGAPYGRHETSISIALVGRCKTSEVIMAKDELGHFLIS